MCVLDWFLFPHLLNLHSLPPSDHFLSISYNYAHYIYTLCGHNSFCSLCGVAQHENIVHHSQNDFSDLKIEDSELDEGANDLQNKDYKNFDDGDHNYDYIDPNNNTHRCSNNTNNNITSTEGNGDDKDEDYVYSKPDLEMGPYHNHSKYTQAIGLVNLSECVYHPILNGI